MEKEPEELSQGPAEPPKQGGTGENAPGAGFLRADFNSTVSLALSRVHMLSVFVCAFLCVYSQCGSLSSVLPYDLSTTSQSIHVLFVTIYIYILMFI